MGQTSARVHGGFHSVLERDHPYVFVDSCMQIWPDADFGNAHRHGVTAYGVTAFMPNDPFDSAVEQLMFWHLIARRHANLLVATTADEIRLAKRDGRAALLLFSQGGDFIDRKLYRIEALYRLGLRVMIPAYNKTNAICDGLLDRTEGGLSRFGRRVVEECNRLGLVLDCTHVGKRSTLDIIAQSAAPVIFSHSNPKALNDNPRNIDDEQIRACAERGGVIGTVSWGPLVMPPGAKSRPTLDMFLAMIDHVAQVTGSARHVGIGTDLSLGSYPRHAPDPWIDADYPNPAEEYGRVITPDSRSERRMVEGFDDYAHVVGVADRLLQKGYSEPDVRGIIGENYLRLFDEVWKG
jgi:membrane dipeptidase